MVGRLAPRSCGKSPSQFRVLTCSLGRPRASAQHEFTTRAGNICQPCRATHRRGASSLPRLAGRRVLPDATTSEAMPRMGHHAGAWARFMVRGNAFRARVPGIPRGHELDKDRETLSPGQGLSPIPGHAAA